MAAATDAAEAEARALEAALAAYRRLGLDGSETRARATRLVERADVGSAAWGLYADEGLFLFDQDQLLPAREMCKRAVASMEEDPGLFSESGEPLRFLAKVELRLGHCEAGLALAARVRQLDHESNVNLGMCAEAELAGGSLARAEAFAEERRLRRPSGLAMLIPSSGTGDCWATVGSWPGTRPVLWRSC